MQTRINMVLIVDKLWANATCSIIMGMEQTFKPNPGKSLEIMIGNEAYLRLPIKTGLITEKDELLPTLEKYLNGKLLPEDVIFVSEKVVCVTQNRIININDIKPSKLARFLAHKVHNNYGTKDFKGFGHGTPMAMQLFIEEAGYPRILFAAAVSAITRPFGLKGAFYYISGKRAKSIDCPMSFTILEYAHYAKLAPQDPQGVAKQIKEKFGNDAVILDANYRGAFSLGKTNRKLTEKFIQQAFVDNPAGQSDEMTPFFILRKKS
jgi:F420-0:gamma-glutamyl ligase